MSAHRDKENIAFSYLGLKAIVHTTVCVRFSLAGNDLDEHRLASKVAAQKSVDLPWRNRG